MANRFGGIPVEQEQPTANRFGGIPVNQPPKEKVAEDEGVLQEFAEGVDSGWYRVYECRGCDAASG